MATPRMELTTDREKRIYRSGYSAGRNAANRSKAAGRRTPAKRSRPLKKK